MARLIKNPLSSSYAEFARHWPFFQLRRHFRGTFTREYKRGRDFSKKEVAKAGKGDGRARGRERRRGRRLIGARVPLYLNGAARWLSVSLQPPSQLQLRSPRLSYLSRVRLFPWTRDYTCVHAKARDSFSFRRESTALRSTHFRLRFRPGDDRFQPRAPAAGTRGLVQQLLTPLLARAYR